MPEATRVLAGASVRREPALLDACLTTLKWQELPPDVRLDLCFVDDFLPDQREPGRQLLRDAGSDILSGVEQVATADFSDAAPDTHHWQLSAFERVAANKQRILDRAVKEFYTHVWICDTDLLLDPRTLASMLAVDKPIVAAVYWTRWQAGQNVPAQPQVWLKHPYELQGRGMDAAEFRRKLTARQLTRVWGLGACMLVRTDLLQKGVRYYPLLPELLQAAQHTGLGMFAGEDRTFCTLAERLHADMWADPWPDIFHVYRPDDAQYVPTYMHEMELRTRNRPLYPDYGDDVSLQIMPCEDARVGPQSLRGRLAALRLLPEIESAVRGMQRGDRRLVGVAFPVDYPLAGTGNPAIAGNWLPYRGTRKVVEVHLVDHRPHGLPPVLRDDYADLDGVPADMFMYTNEHAEQLRYGRREEAAGP